METLLTKAYTCLDQKSKLFKTNSITVVTKELLQRKICVKDHFLLLFRKQHFEKFINRKKGGYKIIWKFSYGN